MMPEDAPFVPPDADCASMSEDEDMMLSPDLETDASKLPDGIKKEVLKAADAKETRYPKKDSEVEVHYVGTLEDGTKFDSSRDRGKPFTFKLGRGAVIVGWDRGVATMKKGELAKFTISSEFAYGDDGSPPVIPAKATLVFEVELLNFKSEDDLLGDGSVWREEVDAGEGYKSFGKDGEGIIEVKVLKASGSVVKDYGAFEHRACESVVALVGEAVAKAIGAALPHMKRKEKLKLLCTKEFMGEEDEDHIVEVKLVELFTVTDVCQEYYKSPPITLKTTNEGDGYTSPKNTSSATLKVESIVTADDKKPLEGFVPGTTCTFTCGDGEVCDAVEFAVLKLRKSQTGVIRCPASAVLTGDKLGISSVPTSGEVLFTVELIDFDSGTEHWSMEEEDKVTFGTSRKDVGGKLFKAGRVVLALEQFKKTAQIFNYTDNFKTETAKSNAKALKKACELNQALCHLKRNEFADAKAACNLVIKDDPKAPNIKALYRRAQAHIGLEDFLDAIADLKAVIGNEPANPDARTLMKQALALQKKEDNKQKSVYSRMVRGLGSGAVREPFKDDRFDNCDFSLTKDSKKEPEVAETNN